MRYKPPAITACRRLAMTEPPFVDQLLKPVFSCFQHSNTMQLWKLLMSLFLSTESFQGYSGDGMRGLRPPLLPLWDASPTISLKIDIWRRLYQLWRYQVVFKHVYVCTYMNVLSESLCLLWCKILFCSSFCSQKKSLISTKFQCINNKCNHNYNYIEFLCTSQL